MGLKDEKCRPSEPCTICLNDYVDGDEICCSHNRDCCHVFHRDCILEWLIRHGECPICRQDYLAPEEESDDEEEPSTPQARRWWDCLATTRRSPPSSHDIELPEANGAHFRPRLHSGDASMHSSTEQEEGEIAFSDDGGMIQESAP